MTDTPQQTEAPSVATAVAKADGKKPIDFIQDELFRRKQMFLQIMPNREQLDRFLQIMVARIGRDNKLIRCHPVTIARAFQHCAELDLDPSPALQLVAFVPRWNKHLRDFSDPKRTGTWELTVQTTYRGYCLLMSRAGNISSIEGAARYEKDKWAYEQGLVPVLKHTPSDEKDPGPMIGAWALVRFKDGSTPHAEYMPSWRIEKVRDVSAGRDDKGNIVGPWKDWTDEQAVKTVLKHLAKKVPSADKAQRAAAIEDAEDMGTEVGMIAEDHIPDLEGDSEPSTKSGRLAADLRSRAGQPSPSAPTVAQEPPAPPPMTSAPTPERHRPPQDIPAPEPEAVTPPVPGGAVEEVPERERWLSTLFQIGGKLGHTESVTRQFCRNVTKTEPEACSNAQLRIVVNQLSDMLAKKTAQQEQGPKHDKPEEK